MHISVAEAQRHLSCWLERVKQEPITITRRGRPIGVIITPDEYERLSKVKAYLDMLRVSRILNTREDRPSAIELFEASRDELD